MKSKMKIFFRHQENEKNCNPDGSEQEAGCVLYESYTCLTFDGKRDYIDLGNCLHRLLQQRSWALISAFPPGIPDTSPCWLSITKKVCFRILLWSCTRGGLRS